MAWALGPWFLCLWCIPFLALCQPHTLPPSCALAHLPLTSVGGDLGLHSRESASASPVLLPVMGLRRVSFMASSWPLQLVCSVTSSHRSLGRQCLIHSGGGSRHEGTKPVSPPAKGPCPPRAKSSGSPRGSRNSKNW